VSGTFVALKFAAAQRVLRPPTGATDVWSVFNQGGAANGPRATNGSPADGLLEANSGSFSAPPPRRALNKTASSSANSRFGECNLFLEPDSKPDLAVTFPGHGAITERFETACGRYKGVTEADTATRQDN